MIKNDLSHFDFTVTGGDGDLDFFGIERKIIFEFTVNAKGLLEPVLVFRVADNSKYHDKLIVLQPRAPNFLDYLFEYKNASVIFHYYKAQSNEEYSFPHPSTSIGYGGISMVGK